MRFSDFAQPDLLDLAPGDTTGLSLPAHPQALIEAGPDFLTEAFHAFGSMAPDNRVVRIVRAEAFSGGGSSGAKLRLTVVYARPQPELHTELFVKFSRDFEDGFRDRRRYELEPEAALAVLSRHPSFPVRTPAAYFADFNHQTGTGLLILEALDFVSGGLQTLRKCLDHELTDPLSYYRALLGSLARLAGADSAGRLSPQVDTLFPFDVALAVAADPIPWDEAQLRTQIGRFAIFAADYPQLLPAHLTDPAFISRWTEQAVALLRHQDVVRHALQANPALIALCHWNAHIDNAWFWRDASGALQCGLLDWGRAGRMNVVQSLWGCLSGAPVALWDAHLDDLLAGYADELHASGGPRLDLETLKQDLCLYAGLIGLAHMMDMPALVLSRLPQAATASGLHDPVFRDDDIARGFLHAFTVFLNLWATEDIGARLDRSLGGGACHD